MDEEEQETETKTKEAYENLSDLPKDTQQSQNNNVLHNLGKTVQDIILDFI